jgi:lysophospholipase L1-like esterase
MALISLSGAGLIGYSDANAYPLATVGAKLKDMTAIATGLRQDIGLPTYRTSVSQFVGQRIQTATLVHIGDSNLAGTGQGNGFFSGYGGRFSRSYMNAADNGLGEDRGYYYETLLDCAQYMLTANGFHGQGNFVAGGAANARFVISSAAGDFQARDGCEISQLNVCYDYATSSIGATWLISVDGEAAASGTIGPGGCTGFVALAGGQYIRSDSMVRFECTSGTIAIQAWVGVRKGTSNGSMMFVAPEGSQGFSDFATAARQKAIADCVNQGVWAAAPKHFIISLGLNNATDSVGKQLSPAAYITQLDNLIAVIKSYNGGDSLCDFTIDLPPQTLQATPLAPRGMAEYWEATIAYVNAHPGMGIIRTDLTPLGKTTMFLSDNLHFNTEGHCIKAQMLCDYFGIQLNAYYPVVAVPYRDTYGRGAKAPTMLNTWVTGAALAAMSAYRDRDGKGRLVGQVTKAPASGSNQVMQVRTNVRPVVTRPLTGIMLSTGEAVTAFMGTDGIVTMQLQATPLNAATLVHFDCTYEL